MWHIYRVGQCQVHTCTCMLCNMIWCNAIPCNACVTVVNGPLLHPSPHSIFSPLFLPSSSPTCPASLFASYSLSPLPSPLFWSLNLPHRQWPDKAPPKAQGCWEEGQGDGKPWPWRRREAWITRTGGEPLSAASDQWAQEGQHRDQWQRGHEISDGEEVCVCEVYVLGYWVSLLYCKLADLYRKGNLEYPIPELLPPPSSLKRLWVSLLEVYYIICTLLPCLHHWEFTIKWNPFIPSNESLSYHFSIP